MSRDPAMLGGQQRELIENSAYDTPEWVTEALLKTLDLTGPVWEPCAGAGKMAAVLSGAGYQVYASDLAPRAQGIRQLDFLDNRRCGAFIAERIGRPGLFPRYHIITNPPYGTRSDKLLERVVITSIAHLQQQADCGHVGSQVWLLLRHEWDCAGTRVDLFRQNGDVGFLGKLVLNRRIQWFDEPPEGKNKPVTGRHNFAWFGWMAGYHGTPTIVYGPH